MVPKCKHAACDCVIHRGIQRLQSKLKGGQTYPKSRQAKILKKKKTNLIIGEV